MFNYHHYTRLFVSATLLVLSDYCLGINSELFNGSIYATFLPAVATWYGEPKGDGSGGACGFANDVSYPPYYGLISAGNNNLFKSGKGCGSCYQVKCTQHPSCSGLPVTVTITDECPGACNNDAVHFDLSGKAFGSLARPGQDEALRNTGRINIQYQRVKCYHGAGLTFKIDTGSNPYYLAFVIENENGDGDVDHVEILPSNSRGSSSWLAMQESWGATWEVGLPIGTRGPYSVRLTSIESRKTVVAYEAIPANWASGQYYHSRVNFPYN